MMKRAEKGQELEDLNKQMMHRFVSSAKPSKQSQTAGRGPAASQCACCERLPRRCSSALDS